METVLYLMDGNLPAGFENYPRDNLVVHENKVTDVISIGALRFQTYPI